MASENGHYSAKTVCERPNKDESPSTADNKLPECHDTDKITSNELKNNPYGDRDDKSFSLDLGQSIDNECTEENEQLNPIKDKTDKDVSEEQMVLNLNTNGNPIQEQPVSITAQGFYTPFLNPLLENSQVVIHKANFRFNHKMNENARRRFEVIDETRKHLFTVEEGKKVLCQLAKIISNPQEEPPMERNSFLFNIYDKNKELIAEIYNPASNTCVRCNAAWHCCKRCHFQALVYCPPGEIAGFIKRDHTCFVQEYHILNAVEENLVVMRGGPQDLELFSPNLDFEMGRLAVHGWHGIMHEIKRSGDDYGLTYPLDLDVRVKILLISSVFSLDWLYTTKGGRI